MKTQSSKLLDIIIRDTLYTNRISEQAIPTPKELENIRKYSYEKNIKTPKDAEAFRQWVRITYPDKMMSMGLVSQDQFNDLDATKQATQKKLLRTVWKTYGKEYLEDQGLVDVDTDSNTPWYYEPDSIISAIAVGVIIALSRKYKLFTKLRGSGKGNIFNKFFVQKAAKNYRTALALSEHKLSTEEINNLVNFLFTINKGARQEQLEQFLRGKFPPDLVPRLAEAIAENPAMQNEISLKFSGTVAEQYVLNNMTDAQLKKALLPNVYKEEAPILRKKRARKTGNNPATKPATKTKTTAAVTLKSMGKLKGTIGKQWANFQNASASAENITSAVGSAIKESDISLKTKIGIIDTVTKKLKVKLGSEQGAWLLKTHLESSTFPDFTTWVMDVKSAGVTRTLTETDYLVSKSIWNLTK